MFFFFFACVSSRAFPHPPFFFCQSPESGGLRDGEQNTARPLVCFVIIFILSSIFWRSSLFFPCLQAMAQKMELHTGSSVTHGIPSGARRGMVVSSEGRNSVVCNCLLALPLHNLLSPHLHPFTYPLLFFGERESWRWVKVRTDPFGAFLCGIFCELLVLLLCSSFCYLFVCFV